MSKKAISPTIVILAYSRHVSLARLLQSLNRANYPSDDINLIISLDGGASEEVVKIAQQYNFKAGNVKLIEHKTNLGLRAHVEYCGNLVFDYETVIILEDDLVVDIWYYDYAIQAANFYKDEPYVAGISLYSQSYNEMAKLPFEPLLTSTSGYFMQIPCSWGQLWTVQQWNGFGSWYDKNRDIDFDSFQRLPNYVKRWPMSSWKKFFYAYLLTYDKYFFYPYRSYTSNMSDEGGTHARQSNYYQTNLQDQNRQLENFIFPQFKEASVFYDSHMEPAHPSLYSSLKISADNIEIDIYGSKSLKLLKTKAHALTTKTSSNYIKRYALQYFPVEQNVILNNFEKSGSKHKTLLTLCKTADIRKEQNMSTKLLAYFIRFPLLSKFFVKEVAILFLKKIGSAIRRVT